VEEFQAAQQLVPPVVGVGVDPLVAVAVGVRVGVALPFVAVAVAVRVAVAVEVGVAPLPVWYIAESIFIERAVFGCWIAAALVVGGQLFVYQVLNM
jgi:hypothetical protein